MGSFGEIAKEYGVDVDGGAPFMTVPAGGANLVFVTLAKGTRPKHSANLNVVDVTDQPFQALAPFGSDVIGLGLMASLMGFIRASDERLFLVSAKHAGRGSIVVSSHGNRAPETLDVAVLPSKTVTLAFRYLQHLDGSGQMTAGTSLKPSGAKGLVEQLNAVYRPQANVLFNLTRADVLAIKEPLDQPITDVGYHRYLEKEHDINADVTVFFVGKFVHSRSNTVDGTTFPNGKKHDVIVNDKVVPIAKGVDPFIRALAHEMVHALGRPSEEKRNNVLTSINIETLKLSRTVILDINPVGKK